MNKSRISPKRCTLCVALAAVVIMLLTQAYLERGNLVNQVAASLKSLQGIVFPKRLPLKTDSLTDIDYLSLCKNVSVDNTTSSNTFSKLKLISNGNGLILIKILMYTVHNLPQTKGGDIIVISVQSDDGQRIAGEIIDHNNGTYTGVVKVVWSGWTVVRVKIVSTTENACRKKNAREVFGNIGFIVHDPYVIHGVYRTKGHHEEAICSPNPLIYGYESICNFTMLNGNMPYFCGKPHNKHLHCADLNSFSYHQFKVPENVSTGPMVKHLDMGVLKEIKIHCSGKRWNSENMLTCSKRPKIDSWTEVLPSGYWNGKMWTFLNCDSLHDQTLDKYRICLRNKNIYMFGDSTVRQYVEYILDNVMEYGPVQIKPNLGKNGTYHNHKTYSKFNISIIFKRHEMPFQSSSFPAREITSMEEEIGLLVQSRILDETLIVLVSYNLHFQPYHWSAYRFRIQRVALAIKALLRAKPKATVLFKGPNLTLHDPHIALHYRDIIHQEFHDIRERVIYLDVWTLTIAHNSVDVHPVRETMMSQIHQFMSYVCDY